MKGDFSVECRFDYIWIEEVHLMAEFRQPANRLANMIIDIAQAAEAFEAKVENSERLIPYV